MVLLGKRVFQAILQPPLLLCTVCLRLILIDFIWNGYRIVITTGAQIRPQFYTLKLLL